MKIRVFTLFPEFFDSLNNFGIMSRAYENGLVSLETVQIRDFSKDRHRRVDDYPYAGGSGMVMTPQPIFEALKDQKNVIYMSPRGKVLTQEKARELAGRDELVILCGHYEGIDQRIIDQCISEEISIGDYILSGGEIAAMVLIDSVTRLLEGVIAEGSIAEESHENYLLEYNQYTRPEDFHGHKVPEILLSGNHELIRRYRLQQSVRRTLKDRPDLIEKGIAAKAFSKEILKIIKQIREEDSHESEHHS